LTKDAIVIEKTGFHKREEKTVTDTTKLLKNASGVQYSTVTVAIAKGNCNP
jgi:hypothetical protein